jgi:hypothetical protein
VENRFRVGVKGSVDATTPCINPRLVTLTPINASQGLNDMAHEVRMHEIQLRGPWNNSVLLTMIRNSVSSDGVNVIDSLCGVGAREVMQQGDC